MNEKKIQRRNLITWFIYDFGNSFFFLAIGAMFLAQRVILDNHIPDIRFGASFSFATFLVLIVSPILWARSDKIGKRMPFIRWTTFGLIIVNWLMALFAVSSLPNKVFIVLWLSVGVQFLYQTSLIFYNTLLKEISTEKNRGIVSWMWEGFGSLWRIIGLAIFLPLANGAIWLIGEPGRHQVFLPAFILSTIFMLPMVIWFKEKKKTIVNDIQNVYKKTRIGIKQLRTTQKNVWLYLLAFSLISDIVLTITLYLAVVMDAVYGVGEGMKSTIFVLFLTIGIVSWYFFGRLADRFGYKKLLMVTCWLLITVTAIFFACSTPRVLYIVWIIWWWASWWYYVLNKAFMTKISPAWELWEYFGFYSTFQKAASVTAPLIRWGITLRLIQYPVLKYQVAWWVMIILLIIWSILMYKVKEPK